MPSGSVQEPRRRAVAGAFVALSALVLVPILTVRLPPILDYPNHLARMHILAALPGSPALARWYEAAWASLPNLALDAVVPWIARLIPVESAMKLFLVAMLIGTAGACVVLHQLAFGRRSLWPLAIFLLLYNRMLLWGFLNYLAGLALMLWALAAWIALERRQLWLRLGVGTVAATALYFAHLAAFGCYGLALIAYQFPSSFPRKRESMFPQRDGGRMDSRFRGNDDERIGMGLVFALLTLIPAVALFLSSPTSGVMTGIAYGNLLRKLDLPVSIFDNYDRIFDGLTFAVLLITVVYGLARGAIQLHPRLRWSLLVLLLAFLAMPSRLFSASGLDHRLPIAIAFLFVAGADWGEIGPRRRLIVTWSLAALLAIRLAVIVAAWTRAGRDYAALVPAFDMVPIGGALAVAAPAEATQAGGVPLLHFPVLAALRRDAFVPTIFADPAQQPLRLTDRAARLAAEAKPDALWKAIQDGDVPSLPGYDDLAVVDPPRLVDPARLPGRIVFESPRLLLIRLPEARESSPQ